MAMGLDGSTLYVGNTGGEVVSIVDLDAGQTIDKVNFPAIPRAGNTSPITPYSVAMGLSGSLFEHVHYDAAGQNLSGTLADYLVATAHELPSFEILSMHTPSRATPGGMKGMAEGGVMGAIGALTGAVNDALAPFGVVVDRQPLTPIYLRQLLRKN